MSHAPFPASSLLLTANQLDSPLDWQALFGNSRPVEVEVGSGKGLFLLTSGAQRPETNFLGIEASRKFAALSAERVARRGLSNVRVVLADARVVFARQIPAESVYAVHIYFPDPWWKRRHKKRRVLNEAFVADVERALAPAGELHLWTDVEEYFQTAQHLLQRHTKLRPQPPPPERTPEHDMDFRTHFERKMRLRGQPIFRGRYTKET